MRVHLYLAILALWLIALQCTADTVVNPSVASPPGHSSGPNSGHTDQSRAEDDLSARVVQDSGPQPGVSSTSGGSSSGTSSTSQSGGSDPQTNLGADGNKGPLTESGEIGISLGGGSAYKPVTTTATTAGANASPEDTPKENVPGEHGLDGQQRLRVPPTTNPTQGERTDGQSQVQGQTSKTDKEKKEEKPGDPSPTPGKAPNAPGISVGPPAAPQTTTTIVNPASLTPLVDVSAQKPHDPSSHQTTTTGGEQNQQKTTLNQQPKNNLATTTPTHVADANGGKLQDNGLLSTTNQGRSSPEDITLTLDKPAGTLQRDVKAQDQTNTVTPGQQNLQNTLPSQGKPLKPQQPPPPTTQQLTLKSPTTSSPGTATVSALAPNPNPMRKDKAAGRDTTPQTTATPTSPQLPKTVKGQTTTKTTPGAAVQPTNPKTDISTDSATGSLQNPVTINSGQKDKTAAQTLTSTSSTATQTDSMQTAVISTTEPAKGESTTPKNPLLTLSKNVQDVTNKDGRVDILSLSSFIALVTLVVMAVAPAC